jgi:hypothetical protein
LPLGQHISYGESKELNAETLPSNDDIPLVFADPGGFPKCDRKEQGANNASKDENVSNGFHDFSLDLFAVYRL